MLKKTSLEKMNMHYIIFTLIITTIFAILLTIGFISKQQYTNVFYVLAVPATILVLIQTIKTKYNIYTFLITLLSIFGIISVIYAIKPDIALWGITGRNEGLFTLLSYYIFFLLTVFIKDDSDKKKIVHSFIFIALINVIFGYFQINDPNYTYDCAKGIMGNGGFSSAYNLLALSLSSGLFFTSKNKFKKIIYFILMIIYTFGLTISTALSSFVGLIGVYIVILISILINKCGLKKILEYIFVSIILIGVTITSSVYAKNSVVKDFDKLGKETTNIITTGSAEDGYGNARIYIWRRTMEILPEDYNYITGIGIDNFLYGFNGSHIISPLNEIVDKVHNEYLQILICEGIPAFATYLFLIIFIIFNNFRKLKRKEYYNIDFAIFLAVGGYCIQAFFYLSIIRVATIFFILMGLICDIDDIKRKNIYKLIKRIFDIVLSAILIVVTLPLFIIIGYLIKKDSEGPIFFLQERIGKDSEKFKIIKFRSMYKDSDKMLQNFPAKLKKKFYVNFKLIDDPRITPFGKKIRNYFIDELPQIYNVFIGNMSFVGPRPVVLDEIEKFGKDKEIILSAKPGMTGNWSCYETMKISYKDRVYLEKYYALNASYLLDLKIIYLTIKRLFKKGEKYVKKI